MGEFCIPKIQKRVVCQIGEKCFHDRHFTDECIPFHAGNNFDAHEGIDNRVNGEILIPADACVIAPPQVVNIGEVVTGQTGGCITIEVSYRITTVLQSLSTGEVCIATILVNNLPLNVPAQDVNTDPNNPVVLCKEPFSYEVFKKRPLIVYDARIVPSSVNPGFGRLVVRVEKLFIAVKYSYSALVCEQGCAIQQCVPGFPPLPECPPFTAPTQCPDFCFTDQDNPFFQCTDCPPVQITEDPEECPVPEVGAFEEVVPEDIDGSAIREARSGWVGVRTSGVVILVRRGAQTFSASTDASQLARFPQLRGGFRGGDVITARGKTVTLPRGITCCRVDFVAQTNPQGQIIRTLVFCDGRLIAILP